VFARLKRVAIQGFLATTASIALVVAGVASYAMYAYDAYSDVGTEEGFYRPAGPEDAARVAEAVGPCVNDVCNYLILGSDSRAGLPPEQMGPFGTNAQSGGGQRSDVIMLVHTDPAQQKAVVLSFPRDLWVEIPGLGFGKINESFDGGLQGGGPQLVARTVHELTGLRINHYLYVDLAGFEGIVQALDGVDMCISAENADPATGRIQDPGTLLDIAPGCQRLDPLQALAYVRTRHLPCDAPAPDFFRISRQQQFLRAVLNRLLQPAQLVRLPTLVKPILGNMHRDDELKIADLAYLVGQLEGISTGAVDFRTIGGTPELIDGLDVIRMDPAADRIFAAVRNGSPLPAEEAPNVNTPPSPATISVPIVDRGSPENALAVAQILSDSGFDVSPGTIAFADYGIDLPRNVVAYAPGHGVDANVIQQYLPELAIREVRGLPDDVAVVASPSLPPHEDQPTSGVGACVDATT